MLFLLMNFLACPTPGNADALVKCYRLVEPAHCLSYLEGLRLCLATPRGPDGHEADELIRRLGDARFSHASFVNEGGCRITCSLVSYFSWGHGVSVSWGWSRVDKAAIRYKYHVTWYGGHRLLCLVVPPALLKGLPSPEWDYKSKPVPRADTPMAAGPALAGFDFSRFRSYPVSTGRAVALVSRLSQVP